MYEINDIRLKCIICQNKLARYNIFDYDPIYCETCNLFDNVNNNYIYLIKCEKCQNKEAYYSKNNEYPKFCKDCCDDTMVITRKNIKMRKNTNKNILNVDTKIKTLCNICKKFIGQYICDDTIYCDKCKNDNTIKIKEDILIPCFICNKNEAIYSYDGYDPMYCYKCKFDDMEKIRKIKYIIPERKHTPHMRCIECNKGIYNYHLLKKNNNKLNNIIQKLYNKSIICKDCKKCIGQTSLCPNNRSQNLKYGKYCVFCYIHIFVVNEEIYNLKNLSKEKKVINIIVKTLTDYKWMYNKSFYTNIDGKGCCDTQRRIDLWCLINNTILAIEIDENQHKKYLIIDEESRYNDLFMDFSGKYIFIRYNPDTVEGKTPSYNTFKKRCNNLLEIINNQIEIIKNEKNDKLVKIINLYYNK
jgi:hypothetical protein